MVRKIGLQISSEEISVLTLLAQYLNFTDKYSLDSIAGRLSGDALDVARALIDRKYSDDVRLNKSFRPEVISLANKLYGYSLRISDE